RAGIEMRLPCVNRSRLFFHPEEGAIRTGLEAIVGLPQEVRSKILSEREENGPYGDLGDLRRRVAIGPEALGALVRAGAVHFTGRSQQAAFLGARLQDAGRGKNSSGPPPAPLPSQGRGEGLCRPPPGELFAVDPTEGWSPPDDPPERLWRDQWQTLGFVLGPPLFSLFKKPVRPRRGVPSIASHEVPRYAGRMVQVQGLVATRRNVLHA